MAGRPWTPEEEARLLEVGHVVFNQESDRGFDACRFKYARLLQMREGESSEPGIIYHDKATDDDFNWRDVAAAATGLQEAVARSRTSQETASIELATESGNDPFVLFLADTHIGDWGTDYDLFSRITDEILATPDLYVALLGDLANMAIKLRGVAEVTGGNQLTPEQQVKFLESWLKEIAHKVVFATWDNHGVEREEAGSGYSGIKNLLAKRVVYFGGIGHPDVRVGSQVYNLAVSHRFRGSSIDNPCHAPMRYLRREGHDRELAAQGDYHVPGMVKFTHGHTTKVAINCGSTQTKSPYARRHYSLSTHPIFPGVSLSQEDHCITPYWSVAEWMHARNR